MDPADGSVMVFDQNPSQMGSPFPQRNLTVQGTTAPDGQSVIFEGQMRPQEWTFTGSCRTHQFYEKLRAWVYDHQGRLLLTDHFGRELVVVLRSFNPTPKRSLNVYWRHDYEIAALVLSVGQPTVLVDA